MTIRERLAAWWQKFCEEQGWYSAEGELMVGCTIVIVLVVVAIIGAIFLVVHRLLT